MPKPSLKLPTKPKTRQGMVSACVDLMTTGQFITGVTVRQLAKAWSVPLDRMKGISADASKVVQHMVCQDLAGDDAYRARVRLAFETKIAQLLAKDDAQSARAAMELARGLNAMLGVQRVEQGSTSIADFTQRALEALSKRKPKKAAEKPSRNAPEPPPPADPGEAQVDREDDGGIRDSDTGGVRISHSDPEPEPEKPDPIKTLVEHFDRSRNGDDRTLAH